MDLSLGVKLLDKISQGLAGWNPQPTLSECLSCFAVQIGKRHEKNGALQKASECFRQAMRFHFNKEARGLLTDVLLACHSSKHHAPAINSCELLNLLAEEGRWETLVQKWSALEGCAEKTLMWTTDQVDQLARGFEMAGDQKAAALLYVNQGLVKEAAGCKHEAFAAFRKAYNVGDNAEKSAESGLTRLAVEVGRVQDAATDLLSPLLGGTDEARQRVHTCFKTPTGLCGSQGWSWPTWTRIRARTQRQSHPRAAQHVRGLAGQRLHHWEKTSRGSFPLGSSSNTSQRCSSHTLVASVELDPKGLFFFLTSLHYVGRC